jgi:hypothetical protein
MDILPFFSDPPPFHCFVHFFTFFFTWRFPLLPSAVSQQPGDLGCWMDISPRVARVHVYHVPFVE